MSPRFLRYHASPLRVRASIRLLGKCPPKRKLVRFLLWPIPWHFQLPDQWTVEDLQYDGSDRYQIRQPGILQLHAMPLFQWRDTPLRSLYRLYEDLCCNDLIMMGYECDYFFFHQETSWRLSQIPDPCDPNRTRYAILASMAESLVDAFNWRLELGLRRNNSVDESEHRASNFEREKAPAWTAHVPPVDQKMKIAECSSKGNPSQFFVNRNLDAPLGYLYTI